MLNGYRDEELNGLLNLYTLHVLEGQRAVVSVGRDAVYSEAVLSQNLGGLGGDGLVNYVVAIFLLEVGLCIGKIPYRSLNVIVLVEISSILLLLGRTRRNCSYDVVLKSVIVKAFEQSIVEPLITWSTKYASFSSLLIFSGSTKYTLNEATL